MKFLGMGWPELIIILVVVLIIFGPKNLPKLGKAIGKGISGLRKGVESGKEKIDEKIDEKFEEVEEEKAEASETEAQVIEVAAGEDDVAQSAADGAAPPDSPQRKTVRVRKVVRSDEDPSGN